MDPTCLYFVLPPPLLPTTAFALLGMKATKSFTGCHYQPLVASPPRRHRAECGCWDLALLHLPFPTDAQRALGLEPCSAAPSLLISASSARTWPSRVCFWGHYGVGTPPCGPVSEGRGSSSASVCWHSWFPR